MKHTPEPWYVAHHQFFYAAGHLLVGQTACPPALSDDPVATQAINADRIVACVNACAGVDNETLRKIADKEMDGSEIVELAKVKQQCDELLEVLDKLARLGNEPLFGNSIGNKIALDAILKAQGYKT